MGHESAWNGLATLQPDPIEQSDEFGYLLMFLPANETPASAPNGREVLTAILLVGLQLCIKGKGGIDREGSHMPPSSSTLR